MTNDGVPGSTTPGNPTLQASPILVCCNAPEQVPQITSDRLGPVRLRSQPAPDQTLAGIPPTSYTNTLYKASIPLPAGTTTIRIFFWHVNNFPQDLGFVVSAATSDGSSATITNAMQQVTLDASQGACIAAATLLQHDGCVRAPQLDRWRVGSLDVRDPVRRDKQPHGFDTWRHDSI